jgi:hypothetical protein
MWRNELISLIELVENSNLCKLYNKTECVGTYWIENTASENYIVTCVFCYRRSVFKDLFPIMDHLFWFRNSPFDRIYHNTFYAYQSLCCSWGGVRWVQLVRWPLVGLLYQPRMVDEDECEAAGGIRIGSRNRSPPQIPHVLTRARWELGQYDTAYSLWSCHVINHFRLFKHLSIWDQPEQI